MLVVFQYINNFHKINTFSGSNLLEESQRASWSDLSMDAQNRVASALLTQLEENAFLLADAVTKEKTILQIVKNICK